MDLERALDIDSQKEMILDVHQPCTCSYQVFGQAWQGVGAPC